MIKVLWEIVIVFILTFLNGFFAMSEIALISVRKTRIAALSKEGNKMAKIVEHLHKDPEGLFATIQIGISLITILASAFAGSSLADDLAAPLHNIHFIGNFAYIASFIIVVGGVAFINLVLGELVPKSLGLRYAEMFALLSAYPIWWLAKISHKLVWILNGASNLILKPFKDSTNFQEARLSVEELRSLLAESKQAGTLEKHEHDIIENVFEFSDLTVDKIMIPRTQMTAFDITEVPTKIIQGAIESGYSRVPIYQNSLNNVIGILYTKNLLATFGAPANELNLESYLIPPYFVPSTMKISRVLEHLKRKKLHMALVTDEHGEIEGLVTLEDILEEIVGDIADETDEQSKAIVTTDGTTSVVLGEVSIVDFNRHFSSDIPEDENYSTLSGFILFKIGRFPQPGDIVEHEDIILTVKEKNQRTVKSVEVQKKTKSETV